MIRRFTCCVAGLGLFAASLGLARTAQGALIVGYSGAPTPVAVSDPGVTDGGISRGPGILAAGGGNYASRDWTTGTSPDSSDYIEWGFTATPGYTFGIDLTTLEIQYLRTGSGPTSLQIQISKNGGAFQTIFTDTTVTTQNEYQSINLSSYKNVTSAIFRLFAYNANNASGQLDLTNYVTSPNAFAVAVSGVAAVPEPGSLAAFGLGAVAAGYFARRRRKSTSAQNA
jgi:hypothetical protein